MQQVVLKHLLVSGREPAPPSYIFRRPSLSLANCKPDIIVETLYLSEGRSS